MTQSSETFPTLQRLGIPVEFNYAGIPFVKWDDLARALRRRGLESALGPKFNEFTLIGGDGPHACDVEEFLAKEMKNLS